MEELSSLDNLSINQCFSSNFNSCKENPWPVGLCSDAWGKKLEYMSTLHRHQVHCPDPRIYVRNKIWRKSKRKHQSVSTVEVESKFIAPASAVSLDGLNTKAPLSLSIRRTFYSFAVNQTFHQKTWLSLSVSIRCTFYSSWLIWMKIAFLDLFSPLELSLDIASNIQI